MGRWDRESSRRRRSRSRSRDLSPHSTRKSGSPRKRRRSRSRSRSPKNRSTRDYRSRRSRSRSPREKREKSPRVEDIVGGEVNMANFDISEQQKKLEILMQQRRERVEKWRVEQSKAKQNENATSNTSATTENTDSSGDVTTGNETAVVGLNSSNTGNDQQDSKKKWSLEDEFDDEDDDDQNEIKMDYKDEIDEKDFNLPVRSKPNAEEKEFKKANIPLTGVMQAFGYDDDDELDTKIVVKKRSKFSANNPFKEAVEEKQISNDKNGNGSSAEPEDDVDPLDAFMVGIQEQVKKLRGNVIKKQDKIVGNNKVSLVVGVAKKSTANALAAAKNKGELLEQNQDGLEYSSEEEGAGDDIQTINQNLQLNKQKKLVTISKEDITYVSFRKDFYIEVPELARMTMEEVEEYRSELEGIKVKGKGCPKPIKTWAHAGVSKKILEALKKFGYDKPTPIQAQAVPAIMSGRDLIGIAKTGSGKTLAFLLPMFRHVLDQPSLQSGDGPIAIIMTPTRELATQIASECRKFGRLIGVRVVAVYGGTPISEQISELKPGAEVVVCTPGRMIDMLAANNGRVTNTRRCTYIVLDEADRMFDMGFEPQVMRIIDGVRPDRQTVMFSATFPRIMEALARRILNKPVEVSVGGRSIVCKDIDQNVVVIEEDDKFLKLLELLGRYLSAETIDGKKSAIVFVDKQENADFLLKELMHASYTCLALHGGIDQTDRDSTIADFKANKVSVLVATSVAARGLDVKHCTLVVNYDCPNHYEDYVHRCGRTGRAGNKGYAWTFITPDQGRYAADINKALEQSGFPPNEQLTQLFESYKSRQEALGKTVKSGGGGGFSGKGFKFDETEAQQMNERRKFQKVALGLQDSDDEDPDADLNQEIENMLAPKKPKLIQVTANTAKGSIASTSAAANQLNGAPANGSSVPVSTQTISEKLAMAKMLASKINSGLGAKTVPTPIVPSMTNMIPDPLPNAAALNAKSLAEQRAERLHAKLNYVPKEDDEEDTEGQETEEKQSQFQRFEQELEINDFPQQARWRVTSKEAIAQIAEYSEAGITVRGTYVPPGGRFNPENGERKLYLAIESTSELAVARAKTEIVRLIREELIKLQNSGAPSTKGRYKVL